MILRTKLAVTLEFSAHVGAPGNMSVDGMERKALEFEKECKASLSGSFPLISNLNKYHISVNSNSYEVVL